MPTRIMRTNESSLMLLHRTSTGETGDISRCGMLMCLSPLHYYVGSYFLHSKQVKLESLDGASESLYFSSFISMCLHCQTV